MICVFLKLIHVFLMCWKDKIPSFVNHIKGCGQITYNLAEQKWVPYYPGDKESSCNYFMPWYFRFQLLYKHLPFLPLSLLLEESWLLELFIFLKPLTDFRENAGKERPEDEGKIVMWMKKQYSLLNQREHSKCNTIFFWISGILLRIFTCYAFLLKHYWRYLRCSCNKCATKS